MKNKIVAVISILALGACASTPDPVDRTPITTVRVVNTTAYPEFPNLPTPPEVRLLPFEVDFPRDLTQLTVRNVTNCVNVPEEQRDDRFWARCGENPIKTNSNVFIGLDQQNWSNLNSNLNLLKENNNVLRGLIDQANRQRAEWRRRADQERARAQTERNLIEQENNQTLNPANADG